MPSRKRLKLALWALLVGHLAILLAGFTAPYPFDAQNRDLAFAPPAHIHFIDAHGRFHLRPFIYSWTLRPGSMDEYREDSAAVFPIRFFVLGSPYKVLGLVHARTHLFGVDPHARIFVLGSDAFGRDEFSRLLYGGRVSLFAGLLATILSLGIGTVLGGLAGYYGRWVDDLIMRMTELFLTVPWLYLLLAVRALLPLDVNATAAFLLLVTLMGIIGWARPARLIRGVALSARERDYVLAARGFGASDLYLLRKHILPHASGIVVAQTALYIPQYILAEVTLSFLGLGVSEPTPSWGNMLAGLQRFFVLQSCWWMFAPGVALIGVVLLYHWLFWQYSPETPRI